ncbi:MAG TPA: methyltransferase [Acidimicrobiales bacterium]|nr:methyltransferase [Acidimicrobiales bacterium]
MGQPHYFQSQPKAPSRPGRVSLALAGRQVELETDSGVFSARRLDPGTEVLIRHLGPVPAEGALLDLGCGYGPVAVALALAAPASLVWAVDANDRAVELTRRNAAALGLGNIRVGGEGDVPGETRFAGVWSNPPIRIGKPALHALLVAWLDRLAPGGRARLVVQKHLGSDSLARWLETEGYPTVRVISENSYRILEVGGRAAA